MLASCTKCYEVLREALVTMQRDLLILITKVMLRYKHKFNSQSHLIVYQHHGSWNREVGGPNTPWPRLKPRSNEDASWCKLMRVARLACVWPPTRINSHQLWAVSNFDASTCKSTRVFARLTIAVVLHESCCMRVVDKFWTASGFYFVATGSTKLLSVFLVNFRSTLIDSHACNSRSRLTEQSCKFMQVHANCCLPTCINSHPRLTRAWLKKWVRTIKYNWLYLHVYQKKAST